MCADGGSQQLIPTFFFCPRIPHWRRASKSPAREPKRLRGPPPLFKVVWKQSGGAGGGGFVCQSDCGSGCRRTLSPPLSLHVPTLPFVCMTVLQTPGSSQFYLTVFHFSLAVTACLRSGPHERRRAGFFILFYILHHETTRVLTYFKAPLHRINNRILNGASS